MNITIDLIQLASLAGAFFVACLSLLAAGGNFLLKQIDARFVLQDKNRTESQKHWDAQFKSLEQSSSKDLEKWHDIERQLLMLKAEMPNAYVRREDFIRVLSTVESKIDGLALRIENILLRGDK